MFRQFGLSFSKASASQKGCSKILMRSCSQFEVWSGSPSTSLAPPATSRPSVLLFGFAGSKKHQLEKHSKLYNDLGFHTLYCILPLQHLFHYDIHRIRDCANWVLDAAAREGMERVVCHAFSNNGAALYQQFTHLVAAQGDVNIAGAVFDSAPGPLHMLDYLFPYKQTKDLGIQQLLIRLAYAGVNKVNGASISEILSASRIQKSDLQRTWQLHSQVPWCGPFLKYNDNGSWPTLFLASKKDRQIPWSYVNSVMREQERKGRRTKLFLFPTSDHVAHLKVHPDLYKQEVSIFLESIQ